jgi:hypothetical protein
MEHIVMIIMTVEMVKHAQELVVTTVNKLKDTVGIHPQHLYLVAVNVFTQ